MYTQSNITNKFGWYSANFLPAFSADLGRKIETCILHRTTHFLYDVRWQYEPARVGESFAKFDQRENIDNSKEGIKVEC
jgi:hypothetical protein